MTMRQYQRKIEIARKCGSADLGDGATLYYQHPDYPGVPGHTWSLVHEDGNVIDTGWNPNKFSYVCSDWRN